MLWKVDQTHEAGLFSHLSRWKHGEKQDPDSGAHPLVHLAWRALAIAWQETQPRGEWHPTVGCEFASEDFCDHESHYEPV